MWKKRSFEKEMNVLNNQSVLCNCGHRTYFKIKMDSFVCQCCGRKHLTKKGWFKLKLREAIEKIKIKEELEKGF